MSSATAPIIEAGSGETPLICRECHVTLPHGRTRFCSSKCGTRNRVRRHRASVCPDIQKASRQQVEARQKLRAIARANRNALVTAKREARIAYHAAISAEKKGRKQVAAELKRAIRESDEQIAREFDAQFKGDSQR